MSRHTDAVSEVDARFGRAWRDHHRYVLDIAFRTLGNLAAAEDAVQEAYARLLRVDIDEIDDVRGWLVVVTGRICLDKLRADRRRPTVPGDLDEDAPPPSRLGSPVADPADRVTLDDTVRNALQVVLERLTPAERTAFVLHDVFSFSFDEVATIVGRSPAACRQLASRARRSMQSEVGPDRFTVESAEQRQVTERFIAACSTGDMDGLLAVLDPEVAGEAYVDGRRRRVGAANAGKDAVAANLLRYIGPAAEATLVSLPADEHGPVVGVFVEHRVRLTLSLTIRDGLIHHLHAVIDRAAYERSSARKRPDA